MAQEYLVQKVEEEPLIKTSSRCKDFLIEALKYHLLRAEQKAIFKSPRTLPRTPRGLPKVSLILYWALDPVNNSVTQGLYTLKPPNLFLKLFFSILS